MFERVEIGEHTLYRGDCRDVLPTLGNVDAVVTDPPYGIGFEYQSHDDCDAGWRELINVTLPMMRRLARFVVMPSGQIKKMQWWFANHSPDWIVAWYKGSPGHAAAVGFNDWEPHLVWGRPPHPFHDFFQTRCGFDDNGHPCPKPTAWGRWLVERAALAGGTVLDPFMGSGTTGVACAQTGRKFIGIEKEPAYFAIACRRLEEVNGKGSLFEAVDEPGVADLFA